MRVAIIGNGSIGLSLGALFSRASIDVTIVTRRSVESSSIIADGALRGSFKARFSTEIPEVDAIVVAVKAYSVVEASKKISLDVPVLYLQNGLDILELVSFVKRPVRGVTGIGAYRLSPNSVYVAGINFTNIAEDPRGDYEIFVELRKKASLPVSVGRLEEIERKKAVINAGINPITAILRVKNGELLRISDALSLCISATEEASKIAKAYGVEAEVDVVEVLEKTAENYSSMAMDVMNKRPTEIDYINGKIVEKARKKNLEARINESLRRLVKAIQSLYTGTSRAYLSI